MLKQLILTLVKSNLISSDLKTLAITVSYKVEHWKQQSTNTLTKTIMNEMVLILVSFYICVCVVSAQILDGMQYETFEESRWAEISHDKYELIDIDSGWDKQKENIVFHFVVDLMAVYIYVHRYIKFVN